MKTFKDYLSEAKSRYIAVIGKASDGKWLLNIETSEKGSLETMKSWSTSKYDKLKNIQRFYCSDDAYIAFSNGIDMKVKFNSTLKDKNGSFEPYLVWKGGSDKALRAVN